MTQWCVSGDEVATPPGWHPASQWDRIQHPWQWKDGQMGTAIYFQKQRTLASGISSSNHTRHGCSSVSHRSSTFAWVFLPLLWAIIIPSCTAWIFTKELSHKGLEVLWYMFEWQPLNTSLLPNIVFSNPLWTLPGCLQHNSSPSRYYLLSHWQLSWT